MSRKRGISFSRHPAYFLAATGALTGCAAIQVKLGMKVYLNKIPISSIQASQADGQGMARTVNSYQQPSFSCSYSSQ